MPCEHPGTRGSVYLLFGAQLGGAEASSQPSLGSTVVRTTSHSYPGVPVPRKCSVAKSPAPPRTASENESPAAHVLPRARALWTGRSRHQKRNR